MQRPGLTPSRLGLSLGVSLFAVIVVLIISPGIGSLPIGVAQAWRHWSKPDSDIHRIAFDLRLPRAMTALVVGTTLSICGAVFQTLFRNVLATPYTLGIATGGSLGALLSLKLGVTLSILGLPAISWCAMLGSGSVVAMVLILAGATYRLSGNALVLAGVTIGLFCGSLMMFVTYLADVRETFAIVHWMMGSLESFGYGSLVSIIGPVALAWIMLVAAAPALNQFAMGEEIAASRGVRTGRMQVVTIGLASMATACVVSIAGPIGFVGLVVPHSVRLIMGYDHRLLLPLAGVWGGVFLVGCDWLSHLIPSWYAAWTGGFRESSSLPIGVMTSVIGAPVFLILLAKNRRGRKA